MLDQGFQVDELDIGGGGYIEVDVQLKFEASDLVEGGTFALGVADLAGDGDLVHRREGILSGSLSSPVFATHDGGVEHHGLGEVSIFSFAGSVDLCRKAFTFQVFAHILWDQRDQLILHEYIQLVGVLLLVHPREFSILADQPVQPTRVAAQVMVLQLKQDHDELVEDFDCRWSDAELGCFLVRPDQLLSHEGLSVLEVRLGPRERLQERVHIACVSEVGQSDVSSRLDIFVIVL